MFMGTIVGIINATTRPPTARARRESSICRSIRSGAFASTTSTFQLSSRLAVADIPDNKSSSASKALLNPRNLHELGRWHHVAAVYDGTEFRSYVDGVQDGAAKVHLTPQGAGRTAVGVRMNKVFYFKGAVRTARFTRRALPPSKFLRVK